MKTLNEYLKDEKIKDSIDEDLLLDYFNLDNKDKLDKWLFETYEEWLESNNYIDENKFYEYYKYSEVFNDVPSYWFYQKVLYERLGDSIKTTSNIFYKLLSKVKGIKAIDILSDYIIRIFYNDNFNENSEEFQSLMNFGNYFIQSEQENNSLCIEARIPKEIKNYDFDFLYHVTFKSNYHKIKKYGLTPKNSSEAINHDYKIYLWNPNVNINTIKAFGRLQARLKNKEDFIILKIDLKKFNNDHSKNMKLFGDPEYTNKNALFTLENIPSKYISEYEE